MKKKCTSCKQSKALTEFHKDNSKTDGLKIYCKSCTREQVERRNRERGLPCSPSTVMRLKAVIILGGTCARCGFDDIRALQVDHIDGGGLQEVSAIGTYQIYKRIADGATDGYQVLCANCNWIKRYENNELQISNGWSEIANGNYSSAEIAAIVGLTCSIE